MEQRQENKRKSHIGWNRNLIIALVFVLFILYVPAATLIKNAVSGSDSPTGEVETQVPGSSAFERLQNRITDFTKHMVMRKDLIRLNTELTLDLSFRSYIESTQVLLGKENWLFYKTEVDGHPLMDYMGTNCYTPEQLEAIAGNLTKIRDAIEAEGIRFVVVNCPNKEQIYSEYMPQTVVRISDESRADQVAAYLQANTDLEYVYLKDVLLNAKETCDKELYFKTDTHWNQVGAFIGMQAVFEQIYGDSRAADSVSFVLAETDFSGDLASIAGVKEEFAIDNSYVFDKSSVDPMQHRDETILFIGDSFSDFFMVIAQAYYDEVYAVRTGEFTMEMLKEYNPDIVIWESVERYMNVFGSTNLLEQ